MAREGIGVRTRQRNPELRVGDRVRYSTAFLRATGMYTGSMPFARGIVESLDPGFGKAGAFLATIDWGDPDIPPRVLSSNLQLDRGKGWKKTNPELSLTAEKQARSINSPFRWEVWMEQRSGYGMFAPGMRPRASGNARTEHAARWAVENIARNVPAGRPFVGYVIKTDSNLILEESHGVGTSGARVPSMDTQSRNTGIFEVTAGLDLLTDLAEKTIPRRRRNPEGAPNLAAYLQALGVLKGEVDGDFQAARTLIHNTPADDRSAFAHEVWRRRRSHGTGGDSVPF